MSNVALYDRAERHDAIHSPFLLPSFLEGSDFKSYLSASRSSVLTQHYKIDLKIATTILSKKYIFLDPFLCNFVRPCLLYIRTLET